MDLYSELVCLRSHHVQRIALSEHLAPKQP